MAMLGSLNKPLMSMRGPVGKIIQSAVNGFGAGALVNVFDKEVLHGKMTAAGVNLPFSLPGGVPVRFNVTDLAFFAVTNGIKMPSKGSLIPFAIALGLKKIAESKQWIDPPEWGHTSSSQSAGGAMTQEAMPMISGGLTGR